MNVHGLFYYKLSSLLTLYTHKNFWGIGYY